jgi:hypothetical protein
MQIFWEGYFAAVGNLDDAGEKRVSGHPIGMYGD